MLLRNQQNLNKMVDGYIKYFEKNFNSFKYDKSNKRGGGFREKDMKKVMVFTKATLVDGVPQIKVQHKNLLT